MVTGKRIPTFRVFFVRFVFFRIFGIACAYFLDSFRGFFTVIVRNVRERTVLTYIYTGVKKLKYFYARFRI